MSNENQKINIKSSIIGLIVNGILFAVKFALGIMLKSHAVTADAMNNLSDSLTSLVGFFGFVWSSKPADSEHPYGHQRIEYVSGFLISIIMIYVGIDTFKSAFDSIGTQEPMNTNPILIGVLSLTVVVKFVLWVFYKLTAKKAGSDVMLANAQDSMNDVWITSSVVISILVYAIWNIRIDAYIAMIIAVIIVYSGIQMIKGFIDQLLGKRPSDDQLNKIKAFIEYDERVLGYHDLLIHHYGNNQIYGSVHVEIDGTMGLFEAHDMIDDIEKHVLHKTGIQLSVHLDPLDMQSQQLKVIHRIIKSTLQSIDSTFRFHDLRFVDDILNFDVVVKSTTDQKAVYETLEKALAQEDYTYTLEIVFDTIQL